MNTTSIFGVSHSTNNANNLANVIEKALLEKGRQISFNPSIPSKGGTLTLSLSGDWVLDSGGAKTKGSFTLTNIEY